MPYSTSQERLLSIALFSTLMTSVPYIFFLLYASYDLLKSSSSFETVSSSVTPTIWLTFVKTKKNIDIVIIAINIPSCYYYSFTSVFHTIFLLFLFLSYIIVPIVWNEFDILNSPITTSGTIKYPTNSTIIGANPITFPIIPFLEINFSFEAFLFSW